MTERPLWSEAARRSWRRRTTTDRSAHLVSLHERFRWLNFVRCIVLVVPLLLWQLLPGSRSIDWDALAIAAIAYAATALASVPVVKGPRPVVVAVLSALLLVDGAYLGWAFRALDGFGGPIPYLILFHALSTTLLGSFRTGLKLAIWHCVVGLVVIEGDRSGMFGRQVLLVSSSSVMTGMAVLLLLTMTTAVFAAANERELRRRRYDSEVLRAFAVDIEGCSDERQIGSALARLGTEELLARRALVLFLSPGTPTAVRYDDAGVPVEELLVRSLVLRNSAGEAATPRPAGLDPIASGAPTPGPLLARAVQDRRPLLVKRIEAQHGPLLGRLLPGAQHLVVVPFGNLRTGQGVLVLDFGRTRRESFLRSMPGPATIEARLLGTARQATAHAGQALERVNLLSRLQAAADVDGLTGVLNRRALDDALAGELDRCRDGGGSFALLLVDLDHFKSLNDEYGHLAGDDALRALGGLLRGNLRSGTSAGRYGGEEFCVLVPDVGVVEAAELAERLREDISRLPDLARQLTASIGVACFPGFSGDGCDGAAILAAADVALYQAKSSGRNRVCVSGQDVPSIVGSPAAAG